MRTPLFSVVGLALAGLLIGFSGRTVLAQEPPRPTKADLGAFTKEVMLLKLDGDEEQLAMWFPFEFFVEANVAQGGGDRAAAMKDLQFLRPYHTVVLQCGMDRGDGTTAYASAKDVRARATLELESGESVKALDRVPPFVSATVEALKAIIAADGGEGNANMHILIFPAVSPKGQRIIDCTKQGKLTLRLKADDKFKDTRFVWRTPFDALTPVPPCAKCKEPLSAKWLFCPWCGAKPTAR